MISKTDLRTYFSLQGDDKSDRDISELMNAYDGKNGVETMTLKAVCYF